MWHSISAGVRAAREQAKLGAAEPSGPMEDDGLDAYNAAEERIAVGVDPAALAELGSPASATASASHASPAEYQ